VDVVVDVAGQITTEPLVSYSPATPLSFSGCPEVTNCPRNGLDEFGERIIVNITGQNFGPDTPIVLIGGTIANALTGGAGSVEDTHGEVLVYLPVGSGRSQKVSSACAREEMRRRQRGASEASARGELPRMRRRQRGASEASARGELPRMRRRQRGASEASARGAAWMRRRQRGAREASARGELPRRQRAPARIFLLERAQ
jgi:hypothetical protein